MKTFLIYCSVFYVSIKIEGKIDMVGEQFKHADKIEIHIVDDNETNVLLLSDILMDAGYSIRVSATGEEAIQSIRKKLPFIILLDIRMPDMDGFEVCRILKADKFTSNVPVIFISALITEQYKVVGFRNGGVDFITKPFRKEEVLARIKTHVKLNMMILELEVQKCQLIAEIEERRIAEEKLHESEERYLAFINSNQDMIFVKDDQFRYLIVNDAMAGFFGKTKEEMLNKTDAELTDSQLIFPCKSSDLRALESMQAFVVQEKLGDRLCETTKFQLQLNGNKKGIGGIIHDITERENIANGLKESEEKFRNMADFSPVAIGIYQDDEWVYINPAAIEMSGYSKEEILSRKFWEFADPEYQEYIRNNGLTRQEGNERSKSYELKISSKSGIPRWVYLKGSGIKYNGRPAGIVSMIDITEKKKADKEIQEERLLLRTLIDNLPDTVYVKDAKARKLLTNLADLQKIGIEHES
ncbi:MAG: PAS domain S-box protein [Prolixibacteraceae bacterium]